MRLSWGVPPAIVRISSAFQKLSRRALNFFSGFFFASSGVEPAAPTLLSVGLTNACNIKCEFCFQSASTVPKAESRKKGMMSRECFETILRQAKGWIDFLEFDLFGEPTTHPEFADYVACAVASGFTVGVYTNGVLLDEEMARRLVAAGPHSVVFSMEGGTAESFERVRRTPHGPVARNLARLVEIRRSMGRKKPLVVVEGLGLRGMEAERSAHRARYKALGADLVHWLPAHNWSGPIDSKTVPVFGAAAKLAQCKYPWLVLSVDWDGTVLPCCVDFNARNALGNVSGASLREIWTGRNLRRLRSALRSRDAGRIEAETGCAGCSSLGEQRLGFDSDAVGQLALKAVREVLVEL